MTRSEADRIPGLGPVSRRWMDGVGIRTLEELRAVGAVEAFGRCQLRYGREASRNLLWALHATLHGKSWLEVNDAEKAALGEAAGLRAARALRGRPRR